MKIKTTEGRPPDVAKAQAMKQRRLDFGKFLYQTIIQESKNNGSDKH